MKTACFVADSPRLGRRKIRLTGNASRQDIRELLRSAYNEGAAVDYGAGFMMKPADDNCTELAGEYIGIFFDKSNPTDCERQISERIQVRHAAFWERLT